MTFISLVPPVYINVKQYGATGDGTTDDAAAINTAIAASPVGSTIWFPGNHAVGSTIQLLSGRSYKTSVTVSSAFTFKQKNGANLPAVLASSDWYNNATVCGDPLLLEDIVVDANWSNNTTSHGIVLMNYGAVMRRCLVSNAPADGIRLTSINRGGTSISNVNQLNRVEKCIVNNTGGHGIYAQDTNGKFTDSYLESNTVSLTQDITILVDRGAGWYLKDNHCYSCYTTAIKVTNCWSTFILGNEIDGYGISTTPGFYAGLDIELNGPRATIVEGNIVAVGDGELNESTAYHHLAIIGAATIDTKAIVVGNCVQGGWVNTTASTTLVLGAKTPCAPLSMAGIVPGITLLINWTETITVASITSTTFTPTTNWASGHSGTYAVYSAKSANNSIGLLYNSNGTQTAGGFPCTVISTGNRVDAAGLPVYVDSYTTVGPVSVEGGIALPETTARAVIATSGTITTLGVGTSVVNPAANVTDIRLQAGTQGGQIISIMNVSAFSLTLNTAPYTANVADAATEPVIAANTSRFYQWDMQNALWYRVA